MTEGHETVIDRLADLQQLLQPNLVSRLQRGAGAGFAVPGWRFATADVESSVAERHSMERYVARSDISAGALEAVMAGFSQRLDSLSEELSGLREELEAVRSRLSDLEESLSERPMVRLAFLSDLGTRQYKLAAPIPVVLEEYDDEAIARWPEVEATGAGASELEAIVSLKKDIVALYDDLRSTHPSELGAQAAAALSILKTTIRARRG